MMEEWSTIEENSGTQLGMGKGILVDYCIDGLSTRGQKKQVEDFFMTGV